MSVGILLQLDAGVNSMGLFNRWKALGKINHCSPQPLSSKRDGNTGILKGKTKKFKIIALV